MLTYEINLKMSIYGEKNSMCITTSFTLQMVIIQTKLLKLHYSRIVSIKTIFVFVLQLLRIMIKLCFRTVDTTANSFSQVWK